MRWWNHIPRDAERLNNLRLITLDANEVRAHRLYLGRSLARLGERVAGIEPVDRKIVPMLAHQKDACRENPSCH
jgi:hypothetical protein